MRNPVICTVMAIAMGAMPGALSRYGITEWTKAIMGKDFSYYGTFFSNITGCFLIALFYTLSEKKFKNVSSEIRLAIATGFCGAYTTFSTYGLETFIQVDRGNNQTAVLYWLGSMAIGMVGVQLGVILGNLAAKSNELDRSL